ncbi:hypothetical protein CDL15_Pgr007373 [Punica granatum]|uniref:Wax synthase domain-containing protein n=1 Tax=Punica granatum TaxID=22663 RepID=A0A218X808_PUNGR|nr:hypothetical protein CDL15_Pgr007373 [Punica granatum]
MLSLSRATDINQCSEGFGSLHNLQGMVLLATKVLLLSLLSHAYNYGPFLPPCIVWGLYCRHAFLEIELVLAIYAIPAWVVLRGLGLELEPQFDKRHLTTSLEVFWGRRWNLAVSGILRLTVYNPLRSICVPIIGPDLGTYAAVITTFTVSGLMDEALFFYFTRAGPTWEVTAFFLIQGVS